MSIFIYVRRTIVCNISILSVSTLNNKIQLNSILINFLVHEVQHKYIQMNTKQAWTLSTVKYTVMEIKIKVKLSSTIQKGCTGRDFHQLVRFYNIWIFIVHVSLGQNIFLSFAKCVHSYIQLNSPQMILQSHIF